jgi:hypothetical protein
LEEQRKDSSGIIFVPASLFFQRVLDYSRGLEAKRDLFMKRLDIIPRSQVE